MPIMGQKHEAQKEMKANSEAEFQGAGVEPGIQIWRIENFGVKQYPKELHGTFYSGDSFLILHTYKKSPDSQALLFNLHFWLGKDSSQDEIGTCAYKAVELDDFLQGKPVQYREVQGSESPEFCALFAEGMKILEGGVASGFSVVKPEEYRPRLLHIKQSKNKKNVKVDEVPLALASLNDGDVFIVDAGLHLYQWNGKSAGIFEKRKGVDLITAMKQERLGKPKSTLVEGAEENDDFWKLLGGKGDIPAAILDTDEVSAVDLVLVRVSDASGELKSEEIARTGSTFSRSLLTSDDVFILDLNTSLFVFIGKGCTKQEKQSGMKFALDYLVSKSRPSNIPISKIVE